MVKKTPGVAFYGKVRIPTIGHAEAINTAKKLAKKNGARLTIGLSHTSTPLNSSQKRVYAEKVFGHPVMTGDEHTKNLFSFLSHLNRSHDELHLVAGSDRAPEYRAHLEKYNGKPDKNGNVLFNFKKWQVHEVEGKREDSGKDPTKMSREELIRSASASKLEKLAKEGNYEHFKAYHPGMPESHIKKVYGQIRKGLTLSEEITRKELAPMLDSFVSFASDRLGLKSMPSVRYKTDEDEYNSFAAYNPSSNELSICTANRHPMDIFRSVAHELVHHKQNEDGKLGKDIEKEGATGSDIENEANSEAGKIMRWFAKANPDMFNKTYVVETNTAAIGGGVRGLGNVTGEVSPTGISQYVITNQTSGLWYDDGINSYWLDKKGSDEYQKKAIKGFKAVRSQLNEGINDPGKLKAIFLAGGPGSGKDFVMNSALAGEGLREVNSDNAFEYLMKKHGLDLEMPEEEKLERDIVRGRAKNITKEQERLALAGRLGLIINGTADDLEKIKTIKKNLEADGYETMMVFVNTSNEVSRQRNVDRGKGGGRKVPDGTDKQGVPNGSEDIRTEKWELAQKNIGELQKVFGNNSFIVIDNSVDIRKATPEVKEKVLTDFSRVRRMAQQFVRAENQNPAAKKWIEREAQKRGITQYQEPKRYKTLTQIRQDVPNVVHKPDNELMAQARRLGLSYYGFGRFGRKVNGINKVLFHSKGGKLIRVQQMNEEKKMKNDPCWKGYEMIGKKKKNGKEVPNCVPANEAFEAFMQSMSNKKLKPKKKKLSQEAAEASVQGGMSFGADDIGPTIGVPRAGTPYGFGYGSAYSMGLSESIVTWMQSERTQQKFANKYGNLWEDKLVEAALRLEEAGCGCEHTKMKKSVKKMREGMEGGINNMSPIPTQRKDDVQELNEKGADSKGLYRPTEKGAGLTRKGAKHFGVKTAVTTPPSKLDPKGKAAKRRKSFCARMGGVVRRAKNAERARASMRRWNCEE